MGCGCKKKKQQIQNPTVSVTVTENNNQNLVQLTPEQQKQVEQIVDKIQKLTP